MKIKEISPLEDDFTEVLERIALKPKTLYYRGKMPKNMVLGENGGGETNGRSGGLSERRRRPPTVAIVGTRRNTRYGEEVAYRAAYECAKMGAVVVSGLAYGIDSIAHRGALDAGGITVAVLGTPISRIYPRGHEQLGEEIIAKGGAIISEHGPNEEQGKIDMMKTFLERNRIISGLSDVVLVVEAAERSGSLNTAMHAIEQGRELFAVPGNIDRVMSVGCNQLLASSALVYTKPQDLIDKLFPGERAKGVKRRRKFVGGSPDEKMVMKSLREGIYDGDEIIKKTGMGVQDYSRAVTMLEIRGVIRAIGGNCWVVTEEWE
ncbi:MAG: DNA-processing protein DprA [Candidatus Saccharibacteria bacterium]|nr:DNA-processing protein DprA [Candidatus Saccharibacteria bacterium]